MQDRKEFSNVVHVTLRPIMKYIRQGWVQTRLQYILLCVCFLT